MNERPLMDSHPADRGSVLASAQLGCDGTVSAVVDVREDIRTGREPFTKIMDAAAGLSIGQKLLLIAPFEPLPLVKILAKEGFQHSAHANETGDWEVVFVRRSPAKDQGIATSGDNRDQPKEATSPTSQAIEVDARGLEPPLPMIKILETLSTLPADTTLGARTDRRPLHLYPQLEERGFAAQTEEQSDGSFLTHIRRR